ncbi:MAG: hypothetical protein ABJP48_03415 [Erythrobacter sp.]
MTTSPKLYRLPLAIAAFTASTPAFAHDLPFLHSHTEGALALVGAALAATIGWKLIVKRAKNDARK